jgi:hypothetical protein
MKRRRPPFHVAPFRQPEFDDPSRATRAAACSESTVVVEHSSATAPASVARLGGAGPPPARGQMINSAIPQGTTGMPVTVTRPAAPRRRVWYRAPGPSQPAGVRARGRQAGGAPFNGAASARATSPAARAWRSRGLPADSEAPRVHTRPARAGHAMPMPVGPPPASAPGRAGRQLRWQATSGWAVSTFKLQVTLSLRLRVTVGLVPLAAGQAATWHRLARRSRAI